MIVAGRAHIRRAHSFERRQSRAERGRLSDQWRRQVPAGAGADMKGQALLPARPQSRAPRNRGHRDRRRAASLPRQSALLSDDGQCRFRCRRAASCWTGPYLPAIRRSQGSGIVLGDERMKFLDRSLAGGSVTDHPPEGARCSWCCAGRRRPHCAAPAAKAGTCSTASAAIRARGEVAWKNIGHSFIFSAEGRLEEASLAVPVIDMIVDGVRLGNVSIDFRCRRDHAVRRPFRPRQGAEGRSRWLYRRRVLRHFAVADAGGCSPIIATAPCARSPISTSPAKEAGSRTGRAKASGEDWHETAERQLPKPNLPTI